MSSRGNSRGEAETAISGHGTLPDSVAHDRDVGFGSVRRAYAAVADQYIELFGTVERVHADDLAFIHRHLAGLTGPVLDLGCGPGHLTGYLHSLGVDVTGIDVVPEFVDHARTAHPGPRFTVGTLTTLDVPDRSVSGMLAWGSLIHLRPAELDDVLAGLRRALASGGVLVLALFEGDNVSPFNHKVITAHRWPVHEISRRLARAGFTEADRLRRAAESGHRPHFALAARAS